MTEKKYRIKILCSQGDAPGEFTWKQVKDQIIPTYVLLNKNSHEIIKTKDQLKDSADTIAVPQYTGG